jgi:hypothetical protein
MERLGSLPFVSQPGEAWVYGYNTDVLGCIVERVSGVPLDAYIRDHITTPLGMKDTQFFLPPALKDRFAAVYGSGEDGKYARAPEGGRGQGSYIDGPRRNFAGGAGLLSTARDYRAFLEAMRRGGSLDGTRLLSPLSVKLMATNQVGILHSTTGIGMGTWFRDRRSFRCNGMSSEGAFGWGGALRVALSRRSRRPPVMSLMIQLIPNATDVREVFPTLCISTALTQRPTKSRRAGRPASPYRRARARRNAPAIKLLEPRRSDASPTGQALLGIRATIDRRSRCRGRAGCRVRTHVRWRGRRHCVATRRRRSSSQTRVHQYVLRRARLAAFAYRNPFRLRVTFTKSARHVKALDRAALHCAVPFDDARPHALLADCRACHAPVPLCASVFALIVDLRTR